MTDPSQVTIIDVFSGAGGMSLGWLQAYPGRARIVAAVDADENLAKVYEWNLPSTNFLTYRFTDQPEPDQAVGLTTQLRLGPGAVDVVLAGPPCQSMSTAGKRQDHPDNRLAMRVCDVIDLLRPKVAVIENVPEFGRIHDGRLLGRVRVRLAASGYASDVVVLNATAFGLPQVRMRCFVLAVARDRAPDPFAGRLRRAASHVVVASHRLSLLSHGRGGQERSASADGELPHPPTVGDAIGDLPALAAGEGSGEARYAMPPTTEYQAFLRGGQTVLYNHISVNHSPEMVAAMAALQPGQTPQSIPGHALRRKEYFRSAYARLDPNTVAPTMTTQTHNSGSGRFTHYRDNRVLTVREVARLQSFPDTFRLFGFMETQRRHVGNAVPPLLAKAVALSLREYVDV